MQFVRFGAFKKPVAAFLAASLLIAVPGPNFYQALALTSRSDKTNRQNRPAGRKTLTDLLKSEAERDVSGKIDASGLDLPEGVERELGVGQSELSGTAARESSSPPPSAQEGFESAAAASPQKAGPRADWFSRVLDEHAMRNGVDPGFDGPRTSIKVKGGEDLPVAFAGLRDSMRGEPPGGIRPAPSAPAGSQDRPAATIRESILGNRKLNGVKPTDSSGRYAQPVGDGDDVPTIIEKILTQFHGVKREELLNLAGDEKVRISVTDNRDRSAWLKIYYRLQRQNREAREQLLHGLRETSVLGEAFSRLWIVTGLARLTGLGKEVKLASFRHIQGFTYSAGWTGLLQRLTFRWKDVGSWRDIPRSIDVHKGIVGLFARLPYHLNDMFLGGYFRRPIMYELRYASEDYLSVIQPDAPIKRLMEIMMEPALKRVSWVDRLNERKATRRLKDFVVMPLIQFTLRRSVMAVAGAVAMGFIAPFAFTPVMTFSLTGLPLIGPGLIALAQGIPLGLGNIPFIGGVLSVVFAKAVTVFIDDLVVGKMVNTWVLSGLLTWGKVFKQRMFKKLGHGGNGFWSLLLAHPGQFLLTPFTGMFQKQTFKTFIGMMTVGAEIEGVMAYAGAIDGAFHYDAQDAAKSGFFGFVDHGWQAMTGHHFTPFSSAGAAVERSSEWKDDAGVVHQNLIPFGGAINWGNVLLYKAQDVVSDAFGHHLNLTDVVAGWTSTHLASSLAPDHQVNAATVQARSGGDSVMARAAHQAWETKDRTAEPGDFKGELGSAKQHVLQLRAELDDARKNLAQLKAQRQPVSAEDQAAYEAVRKELDLKRAEKYAQAKLSEIHDLANPKPDTDTELAALLDLRKELEGQLLPQGERTGRDDTIAFTVAKLKAVQGLIEKTLGQKQTRGPELGTQTAQDEQALRRVRQLISELRTTQSQAQAALEGREAARRMLASREKALQLAAQDVRAYGNRELHQALSIVSMVQTLQYAVNAITAGEKGLTTGMGLLQQKLQTIDQAQQIATTHLQEAQQNQANLAQWTADANAAVAADKTTIGQFQQYGQEAQLAVSRVSGFTPAINAILSQLNSQYGGSSGNMLTQANANLALLPKIIAMEQNGTPLPDGTLDPLNIPGLQKNLDTIKSSLALVQTGITKLHTAPRDGPGIAEAIYLVPGFPPGQPAPPPLHNPQPSDFIAAVQKRDAAWTQFLAPYQKDLDLINSYLCQGNCSGTTVDFFGSSHPTSLYAWRDQQSKAITSAQTDLQKLAAGNGTTQGINALIAEINASASGGQLPPLPINDLAQLKTLIKTYPNLLTAVTFPTGSNTPAQFQAKLDLLSLGQLISQAAVDVIAWSQADAVVTTINQTLPKLPPVLQGLQGIVNIGVSINAIDKDNIAFLQNFPTSGNDPRIQQRFNAMQGLLQTMQTALQNAVPMVNQVISIQQNSLQTYDPNNTNNGYAALFNAEITLGTSLQSAVNTTLPWAVAATGAPQGNVAAALQNIDSWKTTYQQFLNGYTVNGTAIEGILQYEQDMADRTGQPVSSKQPNANRRETLYGIDQPYNIAKKIDFFIQMETQRASQFNSDAVTFNKMLQDIDKETNNAYNLYGQYSLPTNIKANDPASLALMNTLKTKIPAMGTALTNLGNKLKAQAGTISVGSTTTSLKPPTGNVPGPTLSTTLDAAVKILQAGKQLVDSTATGNGASASYAMIQYLLADGFIKGAIDGRDHQVPVIIPFLLKGEQVLNGAIADLDKDRAYVRNPSSESPTSVVNRKVGPNGVFVQLSAFTQAGISIFNQKTGWDQSTLNGTLPQISEYYNGAVTLYQNAISVDQTERTAIQQAITALQTQFNALEAQRQQYMEYLSMLNPKQQSALKDTAAVLKTKIEKDFAMLDKLVDKNKEEDHLKENEEILKWTVMKADEKERELMAELAKLKDFGAIDPALRKEIDELRTHSGAFTLGTVGDEQAGIAIPKARFASLVDSLTGMIQTTAGAGNVDSIRSSLLSNPNSLASMIPNTRMMDFGDDINGFYLIYNTEIASHYGLALSNSATLGNILHIGENDLSISGWKSASTPTPERPPYGDTGVEATVESRGKNWLNFLSIGVHRFLQNAPDSPTITATLQQNNLFIGDDFAILLWDNKLYIGASGFADLAMNNPSQSPSIYGGAVKVSYKFSPILSLNAEEQRIYAKDPRSFVENLNLGQLLSDPTLDQNILITAHGNNMYYQRDQIGPRIDLGKMMDSKDTFTVDFFVARQVGTEDINQPSIGATVIKGFTIHKDDGTPLATITNNTTGEIGTQMNILSDRISVNLPDNGITISAQGEYLSNIGQGPMTAYDVNVSKKLGDHSSVSAGYGVPIFGDVPMAGMLPSLHVSLNTTFTWGEIWRSIAKQAADETTGGKILQTEDKALDDYFSSQNHPGLVTAAKTALARDAARKLLVSNFGKLFKEGVDAQNKGAVFDNIRTRGMVGFISNPTSYLGTPSTTDLATGGGPTAGTVTEWTMTPTQKEFLEAWLPRLYKDYLEVKVRTIELVESLEALAVEFAAAKRDLKMAQFSFENAPDPVSKQKAVVLMRQAEERRHQVQIKYNILTGQPKDAEIEAFSKLNPEDMREMARQLKEYLTLPHSLTNLLSAMPPEELKRLAGNPAFNPLDYIGFVEKFSISFGLQFQDLLANQQLAFGMSVTVPVYDPTTKERNQSLRIDARAAWAEIAGVTREYALRAEKERLAAQSQGAEARRLWPGAQAAAEDLNRAIAARRNGLIPPLEFERAYARWYWHLQSVMDAEHGEALSEAWATLDRILAKAPDRRPGSARITAFNDAAAQIAASSPDILARGFRIESAEHMLRAEDPRLQKLSLELQVGLNASALAGVWIPQLFIAGVSVFPMAIVKVKTNELANLDRIDSREKVRLETGLKNLIEIQSNVQFFEAAVRYKTSDEQARLLQGELIPQLQSALGRAQGEEAKKVQFELTQAQSRLQQIMLARDKAGATLGYLLGLDPGAKVQLDFSLEDALAQLKAALERAQPVAAERNVLEARVRLAKDLEIKARKDLKMQELKTDILSPIVKEFADVLSILTEDGIGNPENAKIAEIQRLWAEREQSAYEGDLASRRAQAKAGLIAVRGRIAQVERQTGAAAKIELLELRQKAFVFEGALASLGEAAPNQGPAQAVPTSLSELENRLSAARQASAPPGPAPAGQAVNPDLGTHGPEGATHIRYFYANRDTDNTPINKSFIDGWLELRWKLPDTPPEVLAALAEHAESRASDLHGAAMLKARAEAQIFINRFASDVRAWRALSGASSPESERLRQQLSERLESQRAQITAALALPQSFSLAQLMNLVPEAPGGTNEGLERLARSAIEDARAVRQEAIEGLLGRIPDNFGRADGALKADMLAQWLSYKGLTLGAAIGVFHGQWINGGPSAATVGGLTLEAPDPRQVEKAMASIISDTVRRQIEAQGRWQELVMHVHLLLKGVQDKARIIEEQEKLVRVAEQGYQAAVAKGEKGLATQEERLAAQDALTKANLDLIETMAAFKSDWIRLATELEAMGYADRVRGDPLPRPWTPDVSEEGETKAVLRHWSERMSDPAFVSALDAKLLEAKAPPELRNKVLKAAADYRSFALDAEWVRPMKLDTGRKIELLARADVEGRRLAVESVLAQVQNWAESNTGAKGVVFAFLKADLQSKVSRAEIERSEQNDLLGAMRAAYEKGMVDDAPAEIRGAMIRLERMKASLDKSKQDLYEQYIRYADKPSEFLQTNITLDEYLKLQQAYDAQLLALAKAPELKSSPGLIKDIDGLFDLRGAFDRELGVDGKGGRLRYGRGLMAIDALIQVEENRLSALRYGRAPSVDIEASAVKVQNLKTMRERWLKNPAAELQPLYVATHVDKDGHPLWDMRGWHAAGDINLKEPAKSTIPIDIDEQGRVWLVSKEDPHAREILLVPGADAGKALHDSAADAEKQNAGLLGAFQVLAGNDFARLSMDNQVEGGLSFGQLMASVGDGRVFLFSHDPDPRTGLRGAVHPLQGLWLDPGHADIILYEGNLKHPRDKFPDMKSLEDYIQRLKNSPKPEDQAEAAAFKKIKAGDKGVQAMLGAAENMKFRSLRAGWLSLKMSAYGFAFPGGEDSRGPPSEIYLTKADFDKAMDRFTNAPRKLQEAEADLAAKKTALEQAQQEKAARDKDVEAFKKAAAEKIRAQVAGGATVRPEWLLNQIETRLKEDKGYQKDLAAKAEAANKANEKFMSASRQKDLAEKALKDAQADLEHAKTWRIFRSSDMSLWLDGGSAVVGASARPAFGSRDLRVGVGDANRSTRELSGEILVAVADPEMRLVRTAHNRQEVEAILADATLVDVGGRRWAANARELDPRLRFSHYVDAKTGWPILLNRQFMIDRGADAEQNLKEVKRWAYMPRNWLNILLEIPRSVVKKPFVMMSGEDPNQEGWRGWANAYKLWGGATPHQNGLEKAAKFFDILELFPDKVTWIFDPSQLPKTVTVDSPVRPDQSVFDKTVITGGEDVYAGKQYWETAVRYSEEDRKNVQLQIRAYFEGGFSATLLEIKRGMVGTYMDSKVTRETGQDSILKALKDPIVRSAPTRPDGGVDLSIETGPAGAPHREGENQVVIETLGPVGLATDRVTQRVQIQPGARQAEEAARRWAERAGVIDKERKTAQQSTQRLQTDLIAAKNLLAALNAERQKADAEEAPLWGRFHALAWKLGRQEAIEQAIQWKEDDVRRLEDWITAEEKRVDALKTQRGVGEKTIDFLGNMFTQTAWPMFLLWLAILSAFAAAGIMLLRRFGPNVRVPAMRMPGLRWPSLRLPRLRWPTWPAWLRWRRR